MIVSHSLDVSIKHVVEIWVNVLESTSNNCTTSTTNWFGTNYIVNLDEDFVPQLFVVTPKQHDIYFIMCVADPHII